MAAGTALLLATPILFEPFALSARGLTFTKVVHTKRPAWKMWMWATHFLLTWSLNTYPPDRFCLESACVLSFFYWNFLVWDNSPAASWASCYGLHSTGWTLGSGVILLQDNYLLYYPIPSHPTLLLFLDLPKALSPSAWAYLYIPIHPFKRCFIGR